MSEQNPNAEREAEPIKLQMTVDQAYQLTELRILENIETKLIERAQKRWKIVSVVAGLVLLVAGLVGFSGFREHIRASAESAAKEEVTHRLAEEFPRLLSRIDSTWEAGLRAKDTSEKAALVLKETTEKIQQMEAAMSQLRTAESNATELLSKLQRRIADQSNDVAKLDATVRGFYSNSKSMIYDFSKTNSYLTVWNVNGATMVCFLLPAAPIEGSVRLQYGVYAQPPGSYFNIRNVMFFQWGEAIENLGKKQVYVTYAEDSGATNLVKSIDAKNGQIYADGEALLPQVVKKLTGQ